LPTQPMAHFSNPSDVVYGDVVMEWGRDSDLPRSLGPSPLFPQSRIR
jgi:hypothetical protein